MCSVKLSLLAFYWRIFKQSKIRIPIYVLTAVVSAWGIAVVSSEFIAPSAQDVLTLPQILIAIFECQPVPAIWTRFAPIPPPLGSYSCRVNLNQFFTGNSILNIVTDGALLVLPMPFVWQLQLPRTQKLALSSIFVVGIL